MTNGTIPVGGVIDPARDRFATTAAHADIRVIPRFGKFKDQKINPRFAKTLLQNFLIGEDQIPLTQQLEDGQWKFNFPITSEFGPRRAPIEGASTNHLGMDIGIGTGTPLAYRGSGSYTAGDGMGTLSVQDPQGRPYDIQVLHIDPAASTGSSVPPIASTGSSTPPINSPTSNNVALDDIARERDIYQAYAQGLLDSKYPGRRRKKSTKQTIKERLQNQLIGQILDPLGMTGGFLGSFVSSSPSLAEQSRNLQDYFRSFT